MSQLRKTEPFVTDSGNPWANDKLERKKLGEYLTPIIASIGQPFVVSLHAPFGTGKTVFIKCWQQDLLREGFQAVYFNAWETDFSEDALLAFMTSIKRQLLTSKNKKIAGVARKRFPDLVKIAGGYVGRRLIPLVAKAAARKALGNEAFDEFVELSNATDKDIADLLGSLALEGLKAQEAAEESVKSFRVFLSNIVQELTKAEKERGKRKIIVFVDELDRCRPTYAVEVLECIKHLFSVEGLVFVLAVDDQQLRNAILSVYGPNLDAEGYLRRFIDWQLRLPKPSYRAFVKHLSDRFNLVETDRLAKGDDNYKGIDSLVLSFSLFADVFDLSLRQQEQSFTDINLVVRSLTGNEVPFALTLGSLAALRAGRPDLYHGCCSGKHGVEALFTAIEPKAKALSRDILGGSWTWWKAAIHSWFLSETTVNQVKADRERENARLNELSAGEGKDNEQRVLNEKLEYLEHALLIFQRTSLRFGLVNDNSLAKITYRRLEQATMLSGD